MTPHVLGHGMLTFHPEERQTDRYGCVFLMDRTLLSFVKLEIPNHDGSGVVLGKLRAVILALHPHNHPGDVFHKIVPEVPEVGECIELGVGRFFTGGVEVSHPFLAGVFPNPMRPTFWLNPWNLYKCFQQEVRLEFVVGDLTMPPWKCPDPVPDDVTILVPIPGTGSSGSPN